MAKLYVIKLSEDTTTTKENEVSLQGKQKFIMQQFLRLFGSKQGDFEKYFSIKETLDQIDSIEGNELKLDKEQLSFLKDGFKLSAGTDQRLIYDQWENGLYMQIHKPEEIEV